jgi:hypothetical protein
VCTLNLPWPSVPVCFEYLRSSIVFNLIQPTSTDFNGLQSSFFNPLQLSSIVFSQPSLNNMNRPICPFCQNTLREGEDKMCAPCLKDINANQKQVPPQSSRPQLAPIQSSQPRSAANLKVISAKAAASAHTSTGTHCHQLQTDKAKRAAAKKQASSNRVYGGHPAAPKPPPFTKHTGRVCSVGMMVIYDSGSFTHGLLRGTFAVNRNSETLLADTKEGIFEQLWDHDIKSHDYHSAPRNYSPEYFNLAKTGRAKKSPVVLHSNEVFARYLDETKGEPSLELIFLCDKYVKHNPGLEPLLPSPSTSKTAPQRRRKRKASQNKKKSDDEGISDDHNDHAYYVDSDSDRSLPSSMEVLRISKKAKCSPSTSTKVASPRLTRTKVTSPRVIRNKAAHLQQTDTAYMLPPPITPKRPLQRTQSDVVQAPMTHVVPSNQTGELAALTHDGIPANKFSLVPAFDYRAPIDISVLGRKLPVAGPFTPARTLDGFTIGKKCLLSTNAEGQPEWVVTPYHFKVDESVVIGKGSFRTCYNAVGRVPGREATPMVAKKRMNLPANTTHLEVHKESGGVYAAVSVVIEKFKIAAMALGNIQLFPATVEAIKNIRVSIHSFNLFGATLITYFIFQMVQNFPVYAGSSGTTECAYFFEEVLDVTHYRKYTSNQNFDLRGSDTPLINEVMQALSHWSHKYYEGRRMIADLQGVDLVLTDPLIVDTSK